MAENPLFWGWSLPGGEDVASWGWAVESGGAPPADEPAVVLVYPSNQENVSDSTPYLIWYVTADPDSLGVHVEFELSLSPGFEVSYSYDSSESATNWQKAASPYSSYVAIGGGADVTDRIRFQCPELVRGVWRLRFRATDGVTTSDWSASYWFTTGQGIYCLIGETEYKTIGLEVQERTGGEASPFSFRIPLSVCRANPITRGDDVTISFSIGSQARTWTGTVESLVSQGAEVTVGCLMPDAVLARKLVTGDATSDDVGVILAAFVDEYGDTLTSTSMETTLGVETAIVGGHRSLLEHISEWSNVLGLLLWVDGDGDVHLEVPDDLDDPDYILLEGY